MWMNAPSSSSKFKRQVSIKSHLKTWQNLLPQSHLNWTFWTKPFAHLITCIKECRKNSLFKQRLPARITYGPDARPSWPRDESFVTQRPIHDYPGASPCHYRKVYISGCSLCLFDQKSHFNTSYFFVKLMIILIGLVVFFSYETFRF